MSFVKSNHPVKRSFCAIMMDHIEGEFYVSATSCPVACDLLIGSIGCLACPMYDGQEGTKIYCMAHEVQRPDDATFDGGRWLEANGYLLDFWGDEDFEDKDVSIVEKVAMAIVKSSKLAGTTVNGTKDETEWERVVNLTIDRKYGPYIVEGDPGEWGGKETVATIFMERHGGHDDCHPPLDYYGEEDENGFTVSKRATELLGEYWIEFVNPAVACVYKS